MTVYLDATTLIALGSADALDLLTVIDSEVVVLDRINNEVTTEPARTALRQFREETDLGSPTAVGVSTVEEARTMLGEPERNGDVALIARVLAHDSDDIAVVSDDQRVRTMARTLGATVTGTIGIVVRAVAAERLTADEAKTLVRRLDSHGLHLTGELRDRADELITDAAADHDE
jgi:predicted nucleic acid-binding protein